jgi:lipopolysaccharide transport protein LptA
MKPLLFSLAVILAAVVSLRAADPKPAAPTPVKLATDSDGTNVLIVVCENGQVLDMPNSFASYRGNVQVFDADMSLNCELLTIYFPTNFSKPDLIVAETNVFITQKDTVAMADRVVYNATNELITLTGNVILDTPQATVAGEVVTYNLKTGQARIERKVVNIISFGAGGRFMGSNIFSVPGAGGKPATK